MNCIECQNFCHIYAVCEKCQHSICNDCFGDRLKRQCGNCYSAKKYRSEDTFSEEKDAAEEAEVLLVEVEERTMHASFTKDILGKWEELYLKITGRYGATQSEKFRTDRDKQWDEEEESAKKIVEGMRRRIESNKRRIQQKEKQLITSYFTKQKEKGLATSSRRKKKPRNIVTSKKRFHFQFMP